MENQFTQHYKGSWLKFSLLSILMMLGGGLFAGPFYLMVRNHPLQEVILLPVPFIFSILILFWYVHNREHLPLSSVGIYRAYAFRKLGIGGLFGFIVFSVVVLILVLFGNISIVGNTLNQTVLLGIGLAFIGFCIQASAEELLMRGYLQTRLTQRYGDRFAIVCSAVVFTLLHGMNPNISIVGVTNIFLVGIIFSLIYRIDGTIWTVAGFHIIWNFVQGCIYGINVSGNELNFSFFKTKYHTDNLLTGGTMGIEGSIILTVLFIVLIINLAKRLKVNF